MKTHFLRTIAVFTIAILCSASGCLGGPEDSPEQRLMKQLNGSWSGSSTLTERGTTNGRVHFNRSGTYEHGERNGVEAHSAGTFTLSLVDNETFEIIYSAKEGYAVPPDQGRFESWGLLVLQSTTEGSDLRHYARAI